MSGLNATVEDYVHKGFSPSQATSKCSVQDSHHHTLVMTYRLFITEFSELVK